jgi:hypothetical protein
MNTPELLEGFDPELGLWRNPGGGHTRSTVNCEAVHSAPVTAARLHALAHRGQLASVNAPAVLRRLMAMQDRSGGPQHGCLRWYWEDARVEDANAAFFVALPLLGIRLHPARTLTADLLDPLDDFLRELRVWFRHAVAEGHMRYPNKHLGDLVCAWLLREVFGPDHHTPALLDAMLAAAEYWRREHWGWGEHMSDAYSRVILDEFSSLLLLQRHLPEAHRLAYRQRLADILAIDDQFGSGPRVPAIRSYHFDACPARVPYRRLPGDDGPRSYAGWRELLSAEQPVAKDTRVPCFGGAEAVARIHPDCRLGSVTRYPFMAGIDPTEWGLCWQSFPVAFWRPGGDWGFLQFVTRQGDRVRAHPALSRRLSAHDNALSTDCQPPILGETRSLQDGDRLHVWRRFSSISPLWDCAADRFRLCHPDPVIRIVEHEDGIDLRYPERIVTIRARPGIGGQMRLERDPAEGLTLSIEWPRAVMTTLADLHSEWWLDLAGQDASGASASPAQSGEPSPTLSERLRGGPNRWGHGGGERFS